MNGNLKYFENLDGKQKIVALIILVFFIMGLLSFTIFSSNNQFILISIVIIILLTITKPLWLRKTNNTIRYFSLFIIYSTAFSFTFFKQFIESFVFKVLSKYFPEYIDKYSNAAASPAMIYSFILLGIFIVNYFMSKDNTAMKIHPMLSGFLDVDMKKKLVNISKAFSDDVERIDRQVDWSSNFFTPLDAEVLITSKKGNKRKIYNLLTAIKKSKDRVFLLLGEPGSGKSVALRKLAKELSNETIKTLKIPIYINLKDWHFDIGNEVSTEDLKNFIISHIKRNSDPIIRQFFFQPFNKNENETVFDKLHELGYLYYLFDSFDEIPQVIKSKGESNLINNLSNVLYKYLCGARNNEAQGVLASRLYKKPSNAFLAKTTLEIKPFNEYRIVKTLENIGYRKDDLINELFTKRLDLVQIAKNPFSAMLIAKYAENNKHKLPENKSDLYENFIKSSIWNQKEILETNNLTINEVIECSSEIADIIFSKTGNLEISIDYLKDLLPQYDIDNIIHLLKESRIGRGTIIDTNTFCFSHRRIAEYFYVNVLLKNESKVDFESIPEIGEQRDSLILYCEVANNTQSKAVANYCWNIVKKEESVLNQKSMNSLRFLVEAFRNRKSSLEDFKEELREYIISAIETQKNILILKLSTEALGLLSYDDTDTGVSNIFKINNSWLNETAIVSCRHLISISKSLERNIKKCINEMPYDIFFSNMSSLLFSFSLSDAFSRMKKLCYLKLVDLSFFIILLPMVIYFEFAIGNYRYIIFLMLILGGASLYYGLRIDYLKILWPINFLQASFRVYKTHIFSVENILLPILFAILAIPFTTILYLNVKEYSFKMNKAETGTVVYYFVLILLAILTILFPGNIIFKIIGFSWLLLILFAVIINSIELIQDMMKFKKINLKKSNQREYIYATLMDLKTNYYKSKFMNLLKENIIEVEGEYPNDEFMQTNSKSSTLLAQLEEKWLRLNK
jgi:DNA polymerase III delta prime subunit